MQTQVDRLKKIQELLLQHPEGLTARQIAEEIGVSRTTLNRDLVILEDSLPLWEDNTGKLGIFRSDSNLEGLVQRGENNHIEFKVTACWNSYRKIKEHSLVENVVKSLVGFMNSKTGGIILIGVTNDAEIVGIDDDLKAADTSKPNKDGYELFLRNSINDSISASSISYYDIEFVHSQKGKVVCKIKIRASTRPMYFKGAFYVRNGNQTRLLSTQEAVEYIADRWLRG